MQNSTYDIIVVGGGPSGSMAAIAAAREGSKVLLIEQYAFLGGTLTAMGVGPMMTFHNNANEQVVKGYPHELVERLMAKGASPGHIVDATTYVSTLTPFDSEALKIELETMVLEAGATILYHTTLVDVETSDNLITAILIANKAGLTKLNASVFIDASGDGDLSSRAGVPFKKGRDEDGKTQPMTMNLKVGNVDRKRFLAYVHKNPDDCFFEFGPEKGLELLEQAPRISIKCFIKDLRDAWKRGEISFYREYMLMFETNILGQFIVNVSRIQDLDGTNPYDLSQAETIGRKQCSEIFQFLKQYGIGFEDAIRLDSSSQVGVRESRRIEGLYTLTAKDLIECRIFEDTIALGGYPVDIHAPSGKGTKTTFFKLGTTYGVPLRCAIPKNLKNLLVNGRCLSATHEALAGVRVTPIMMAFGQGIGLAASKAVELGVPVQELPFEPIAERLQATGALVRLPEGSYMFSEDFGKDDPLDDPNSRLI
jgi:hypothetical protein